MTRSASGTRLATLSERGKFMASHFREHQIPLEAAMKVHVPENADHELRKAYNAAIDTGMQYFWNQKTIPGVNAEEVFAIYKHAFHCHQKGEKLAAERWARAAKHLSRAFTHEAKITFLEPRIADLPYLKGASAADFELKAHSDTTADLLDSLAQDLPPGFQEMPEDMKRYISRGRKHLEFLDSAHPEGDKHELLRAERIKAAHEYGRVVECLALAYESEAGHENPYRGVA
jgi:hypothetical protein